MKDVFKAFADLFKAAKGVKDTTTTNGKNEISVFSFTEIGTIQHFELCKKVVSESKVKREMDANSFLYSIEDTTKAKTMLSKLRKENKCLYDHFQTILQVANAKTDTAKAVTKTGLAHTSQVQDNIRSNAKGALNYAIKKYNNNGIVTISEIKEAFETLSEGDIYKYYSVSTMCFNCRGLLAKCVNNAMQKKVKAQKESAKAQKAQ